MSPANPFEKDGGLPSVSFGGKDPNTGQITTKQPGYEIHIRITKLPNLVQSRKYGGNELLFWDPNKRGEKTTVANDQPVMSVVTHGKVEFDSEGKDVGVEKALWAQKPSALFGAIGDAISSAGVEAIEPGALMKIKLTGFKQGEDKTRAAAKTYEVTIVAPNAFSAPAALAAQPAGPPAPAPAPAPAPTVADLVVDGFTKAQWISSGYTDAHFAAEPRFSGFLAPAAPAAPPAPPAPPMAPPAPPAPAAATEAVEDPAAKRAAAMAALSPEDRALLGL